MLVMEPRDLYGLSLERFTEERNALARQARREGRREEATNVLKLRKPSVAAWAVNQLVRTQNRDVAELFRAGDGLQRAQQELLAGQATPGELRKALDAERAAVEQLIDKARGLLSSDGHELTPARLEQVSETLHASALDADARAEVREGCLNRELRHIGLGALGADLKTESRSATRTRRPRLKPDTESEVAESRKTSDGRAAQLKAARRAAAEARQRAERTARAVETAQQKRDRAAWVLREAEQALATASEEAERAARELKAAQQAVQEHGSRRRR